MLRLIFEIGNLEYPFFLCIIKKNSINFSMYASSKLITIDIVNIWPWVTFLMQHSLPFVFTNRCVW